MSVAYLFLDLQQDFLTRPGLVPSARHVIEAAADLLAHARREGITIVHARTVVEPDGRDAMPHWQGKPWMPCRRGTPGCAPPAALQELPSERVVEKRHYSAFSDPALDVHLREQGVSTLVLLGLYTHACIRATALDAYRHGYGVLVADEATGSTEPVHAALSAHWLGTRGIATVPSADLVRGASEDDFASPPPLRDFAGVLGPQPNATPYPLKERQAGLRAWARWLRSAREQFIATMIQEIGKPRRYCAEEMHRAARHVEIACEYASSVDTALSSTCRIRHRPRGTIAMITPWNNPVAIPASKLAPALLYGNRVVWKPSPRVPRTSALLFSSLLAAGLPADRVQMVQGGAEEARALASAAAVDAVTITGSWAAGRGVEALCRARGLPFQAELGGNNAAIVGKGADLEHAADRLTEAAFGFAGQRCTAVRRVIVRAADKPTLLSMLIDRAEGLPLLAPNDPAAVMGPVVDAAAVRRLQHEVHEAEQGGARLRTGGKPAGMGEGAWFQPTILEVEDRHLPIVQEESFGPILVVQTAQHVSEQLALLNGVSQGLHAVLFSQDAGEKTAFLHEAAAGILRVNPEEFGFDVRAPFGGWKASGVGPPEHGVFDREFYAVPQAVYGEADPA